MIRMVHADRALRAVGPASIRTCGMRLAAGAVARSMHLRLDSVGGLRSRRLLQRVGYALRHRSVLLPAPLLVYCQIAFGDTSRFLRAIVRDDGRGCGIQLRGASRGSNVDTVMAHATLGECVDIRA